MRSAGHRNPLVEDCSAERHASYVWSKAILENTRTEVLGHTPGRMGNNAC